MRPFFCCSWNLLLLSKIQKTDHTHTRTHRIVWQQFSQTRLTQQQQLTRKIIKFFLFRVFSLIVSTRINLLERKLDKIYYFCCVLTLLKWRNNFQFLFHCFFVVSFLINKYKLNNNQQIFKEFKNSFTVSEARHEISYKLHNICNFRNLKNC